MGKRHRKKAARPPVVGGIVEIRCPEGHTLGRVVSTGLGEFEPIDGNGWLEPFLTVGEVPTDEIPADPTQPLPSPPIDRITDKPLRMHCVRCNNEGRRPDLRGSWDRVQELADQLETDTSQRTLVYTIGG